jgi:PadR family transcriptional regulator, regulatory protein AphA
MMADEDTPARSIVEELTPTSYAILSLLGVRPWSAYELTQQMNRSVGTFWPKAESLVYAECKRLAARGLAAVDREMHGRRPRTIYTITDEGRSALRRWLDQPTAGPRLEWEAMIQVAFADHGTRAQLLENLRSIRAAADQRRAQARAQVDGYLTTGGPFPHRLPVIAITGKFFLEFAELVARWAEWAEQAVEDWTDLPPEGATVPNGAFEPGSWPDPKNRP